MFGRVSYEDWHALVRAAAMLLVLGAFLYFAIRAFRMKDANADKASRLPFEPETPAAPHEEGR